MEEQQSSKIKFLSIVISLKMKAFTKTDMSWKLTGPL